MGDEKRRGTQGYASFRSYTDQVKTNAAGGVDAEADFARPDRTRGAYKTFKFPPGECREFLMLDTNLPNRSAISVTQASGCN
jgi:hypothetical protein